MDPGKANRTFFENHVFERTGADREDVRLGPTYGADFGAIDVGGRVLALASDPIFVLRDLGIERAAWYAFHICVSDVALSGLSPTHLSVDLNLPPGTPDETFDTIWSVFDREARNLGISIVTGHTGTYEGCSFPTIGGATALAVGEPDEVVYPTGAQPGDRLVVTKGPAIESTGMLAVLFGDDLPLSDHVIEAAKARFDEVSPVRDALTAASAGGVTAMHDATERGLANGFHELATASDVGFTINRDAVPVVDGVREICDYFDIEPWTASSEGTVVMTVAPDAVSGVLDALSAEGIRAADVGEVTANFDDDSEKPLVTVDGTPLREPDEDPLWGAYEMGLERFGIE